MVQQTVYLFFLKITELPHATFLRTNEYLWRK